MDKPTGFHLILFTALAVSFSGNVFALSKQEMGTVINLAGKQRMLTQKMSKEILLIAKGIGVNGNKAGLEETADLFDKALKGLINGDKDLGLAKTSDVAIRAQLEEVSGLWVEFRPNVDAALSGKVDKTVLEKVAAQNLPLLKSMNEAVQMYARMSGSDLSPVMVATVNLAGKQRMLTQKMTKELLLIANDIGVDANKASLQKSVALFERTLNALLDGDGELGLPGTRDVATRIRLDRVQKLWADYKPVLDKADTSPAGLKKAARLNTPLLVEMSKVVKMYEKLLQ